jgi:hypothetical protein
MHATKNWPIGWICPSVGQGGSRERDRNPVGASEPAGSRNAPARSMQSTMKPALALLLLFPFFLPFGGAPRPLTRAELQREILAQMNGRGGERITRDVVCRHVGVLATAGPVRYTCMLRGARGRARARVTVTGRTWRADWAPVDG